MSQQGSLYMKSGATQRFQVVRLPQGFYKFVTIYNNTPNPIDLYQGAYFTNTPTTVDKVSGIPAFQALTIKLPNDNAYTFVWTDGGSVDVQESQYDFTVENLGVNTPLGTSNQSNVSIISDSVGLARQAQLPSTLTSAGNLKVSVAESTGTITTQDNRLPATLDVDGGLKVHLQNPQTSVSITGSPNVNVSNTVTTRQADNTARRVTTTGLVLSGTSTLVRVVIGKAGAAGDTLTIRDGTSSLGSIVALLSLANARDAVFDAAMAGGIYVEFSAAGADVTIMTR